jgi:hypothetical protein
MEQLIFYIDSRDEIREGIFKGIVNGYNKYTHHYHINDKETGENILIDEDDVFFSLEEAKSFLK